MGTIWLFVVLAPDDQTTDTHNSLCPTARLRKPGLQAFKQWRRLRNNQSPNVDEVAKMLRVKQRTCNILKTLATEAKGQVSETCVRVDGETTLYKFCKLQRQMNRKSVIHTIPKIQPLRSPMPNNNKENGQELLMTYLSQSNKMTEVLVIYSSNYDTG